MPLAPIGYVGMPKCSPILAPTYSSCCFALGIKTACFREFADLLEVLGFPPELEKGPGACSPKLVEAQVDAFA